MNSPLRDPALCPALFVAAPASGQGKTTVTAALARLHTRQGRRVTVFKCGPDFLDPQIHALASGRPAACSAASSARNCAGVSIAQGSEPRPPARPTAMASALVCTPAIGAWMIGSAVPRRSVRDMAHPRGQGMRQHSPRAVNPGCAPAGRCRRCRSRRGG